MPSIAPDINDSYVHVAVAVVTNANGEVLLSLRPAHVHQGGLWEFPGGKVEHDESLLDALRREIREELGIYVENALPLMRICHKYPDKSVLLDVCCINSYNGVPQGLEGQQIRWVKIEQLDPADFPAANKNIIRAL
ncbi:MAG: 8-oxo-dGTP diphosphatase MutT, partial [Gammaproteobacteria bacterium]